MKDVLNDDDRYNIFESAFMKFRRLEPPFDQGITRYAAGPVRRLRYTNTEYRDWDYYSKY